MKIRIKRGLDIPFADGPEGGLLPLPPPRKIALNLDPFDDIRFRLLVKAGESVKLGQPLVENKAVPGQMFVSPAGGVVSELRRGLQRRLLDIVIDVAEKEELFIHEPPPDSREGILDFFLRSGVFPHIRLRPFNLIADPTHLPRAIFVRALESLPYVPTVSLQVEGRETYFAKGLETLTKIAPVHLVHREGTKCRSFTHAVGVEKHSIRGPHPAGNHSVHIHHIMPIKKAHDYTWTIDVEGVVTIGALLLTQTYSVDRIIALAGAGVKKGAYFSGRMGYPVADIVKGRTQEGLLCFISGDPLSGSCIELSDYLGFFDSSISVLPVNVKREMVHFLRWGWNKYSATRTYFSGFCPKKEYSFTTNQHGESRSFIDSHIYDRVMPMRIPTVQLVKALLAQDFELAELLGVYEVAPEDFILPTFICPSKIEMVDIVKQGLRLFAKEMGH